LAGSGGDGSGIHMRGDFRDGPAAARLAEQGMARDIEERLRKRVWKHKIGIDAGRQDGDALGERFDERHAQRPGIAGGCEAGRRHFGRSVVAGPGGWSVGLGDRRETVGGELELISGGENVGWSYMSMDKPFTMEIDENIENRPEHVARFSSGKGTLREDLREVFFGKFHYGIKKIRIAEAATAEVVKAQQIGMSELRGAAPARELEIDCGGIQRKKLDGGLLRLRIATLSEEDGAVVIAR